MNGSDTEYAAPRQGLDALRDVLARHTVTRCDDGTGRCDYCNERVLAQAAGCLTAVQVRAMLARGVVREERDERC